MARQRFEELDALRGFAALAVVLYHYSGHLQKYTSYPWHFLAGEYGVQLFFCISGFVIFWTLQRSATLADFAVSRFSRLYPAYWAAIGLAGATAWLNGDLWVTGLAVNATMLQKFVGFPDLDLVYWTLAVELVFYVWMAAAFAAKRLDQVLGMLTAWLAVAAVTGFTGTPAWLETFAILTYIPYFAAGIVFYLVRQHGWRAHYAVLIAAAFGVICIRSPWDDVAASAVVLAIFGLAISGRLWWIVNRATVWLGAISYSLYLTHRNLGYEVLNALARERGVDPSVAFGVAIVAALAVASALTYFIEKPALRWIRERYGRASAAEYPESRTDSSRRLA